MQTENNQAWHVVRRGLESCDMGMHFHLCHMVAETDWTSELTTIPIPALVLSGEKDSLFTSYNSIVTSGFIPNAQYVNILDASNMVFIDKPHETIEHIIRFLNTSTTISSVGPNDELTELHKKMKEKFIHLQRPKESQIPTIRIRLLGEFSIHINETRVEKGWHKRLAKNVLLYLTLYRKVFREQLLEDFWPEDHVFNAQNKLRVCLNHLKSLLAEYDCPNILIADRQFIHMNAAISADIYDMYQILINDSFDEYRERIEVVLARYGEAVSHHNFLMGFCDEWSVRLKRKITSRMQYWAGRLSEYYLSQGNPEAAASYREIHNRL